MLTSLARPINHAACGTDGSKLYAFGGRGGGNNPSVGYDTVQVYTPSGSGGSWVSSDTSPGSVSPLPQGRGGMGNAVYLNGKFYVMGGETTDGAAGVTGAYSRVDIYTVATRTWTSGADLPQGMHGLFPVALPSGKIIVAGGGVKSGPSSSKNVFVTDVLAVPATTSAPTTSGCATRTCTYSPGQPCK